MEIPTVDKILDFGQGDDDAILEIFEGLLKLVDGYYTLMNYGDDWWEAMNQTTWFNEMASDAWKEVDWNKVEDAIVKTSMLMIGAYIKTDKFLDALEAIKEAGLGYRPHNKSNGEGNA